MARSRGNQARSIYRFNVLPEQTDYPRCTMKIGKKLRRVEPPDSAKGVMARAYLFMACNKAFSPNSWEKPCIAIGCDNYENPYITN